MFRATWRARMLAGVLGAGCVLPSLAQDVDDSDLFPNADEMQPVAQIAPASSARGAAGDAPRVSYGEVRATTRDPRLLGGVREYPAGFLRALIDLAAEPLVLQQVAEEPQLFDKPDAAQPPIPDALRPAIMALRNAPEAVAIAAAHPAQAAALRRLYLDAPEDVNSRVGELREQYRRANLAAAAAWQRLLEHDPVALGEYRDLVTEFAREIRKEAPNFAVIQVLDRRYYTAAPPDAQLVAVLGERAETQALRRVLSEWSKRNSAERQDELALRGGAPAPRLDDMLVAQSPAVRGAMWRPVAADQNVDAGVDLMPVMLQPADELDDSARLAHATLEHARLWDALAGARHAPSTPRVEEPPPQAPIVDHDYDGVTVVDGPAVDDGRRYVTTDVGIGYSQDYDEPYYGGTVVVGGGDYGYIWNGYYGYSYPFFGFGRCSAVYYPYALCSTLPGYVPAQNHLRGHYRDYGYHGRYDGNNRRYSRYRPPALNPGGYPLPDYPQHRRDGRQGDVRGGGVARIDTIPRQPGGAGPERTPPTPREARPNRGTPPIPGFMPPRTGGDRSPANRGGGAGSGSGGRRGDAGSSPEVRRPARSGMPGFLPGNNGTRGGIRSNDAARPTVRSAAPAPAVRATKVPRSAPNPAVNVRPSGTRRR